MSLVSSFSGFRETVKKKNGKETLLPLASCVSVKASGKLKASCCPPFPLSLFSFSDNGLTRAKTLIFPLRSAASLCALLRARASAE